MTQEKAENNNPEKSWLKTNNFPSKLRNILRIWNQEDFIQYVVNQIKDKSDSKYQKIIDSGKFFNEESLANEYHNFLKFEELFIRKILAFVERCIESEPNKKLVLLFDLDETLLTKGKDDYKVDYLRPSFRFIWFYLRKKYKNKIDFWTLTSRWQWHELPDILKKYMNPELCFSTRDSTFSINWIEIYIPYWVVPYFTKENEYLKDRWISDENCVNIYYDKAYWLLKIRDADPNRNYVAIDDCFNYGRDRERKFTIIEQGIALWVYDCMFLSSQFV